MAIDNTYIQILVESYIKDQLKQGNIPGTIEIQNLIDDYIEDDLTKPVFNAETWKVDKYENSSVSKFKGMVEAVYQDLRALLYELKRLSTLTIRQSEQWKIQLEGIEKEMLEIEDRTQNLILVAQDTEGYIAYVSDIFKDSPNLFFGKTQ